MSKYQETFVRGNMFLSIIWYTIASVISFLVMSTPYPLIIRRVNCVHI